MAADLVGLPLYNKEPVAFGHALPKVGNCPLYDAKPVFGFPSVSALAKATGLNKSHLSRWLRGERILGSKSLAKLEVVIGKVCPNCRRLI